MGAWGEGPPHTLQWGGGQGLRDRGFLNAEEESGINGQAKRKRPMAALVTENLTPSSLLLVCLLSRVLTLLKPCGLRPLQAPLQWDSPGKDSGLGCHFLLQGIFLTQGSNLLPPHWQVDSLLLSPPGKPPSSL